MNATEANSSAGQLSTEVVQQISLLSMFMAIALVGNLTVLAYLCKTQAFNRPVSIFVLSLALSKRGVA